MIFFFFPNNNDNKEQRIHFNVIQVIKYTLLPQICERLAIPEHCLIIHFCCFFFDCHFFFFMSWWLLHSDILYSILLFYLLYIFLLFSNFLFFWMDNGMNILLLCIQHFNVGPHNNFFFFSFFKFRYFPPPFNFSKSKMTIFKYMLQKNMKKKMFQVFSCLKKKKNYIPN